MNQDPDYNRLRELSWRRPLTEGEQAEVRAWLAAHPEAQAEWEAETNLSTELHQLPDAPMPSNFTARVRQAVERETAAARRRPGFQWAWRWRVFLPRVAGLAVIIGFGLFAHHRHVIAQQAALMKKLAAAPELANPAVLEDFEAIVRLGSTPRVDEDLLALMKFALMK
jgi:anti-sigma factor RsiW